MLTSIVGIFLTAYVLIQIPWVQNRIVKHIANNLSDNIGTEVQVGHVSFSLFNSLDIDKVLIRDQQKDSLLYTQSLKLRITDLLFTKSNPTIKYLGLEGTKIYLHRNSLQWNYQFLIDYFKKDSSKKNSTHFSIQKIDLSHFSFIQDDQWNGSLTSLSADNLIINFSAFTDSIIRIDQLVANRPFCTLLNKKGLNKNFKHTIYLPKKGELYFGHPSLAIIANNMHIKQGKFWIENGFDQPTPQFDGFHIRMNELNAKIQNASFIKDTIRATVQLNLKERSGLHIKSLQTQFKMTPSIMELDKLQIKTNHSILGPYYAMEYTNFVEDFYNYNYKVKMKAHFVNAAIASDDIAFFAPEIKQLHQSLHASFHFDGTVNNFKASNLAAQYGKSFVKGNFSMKGIPDMRNTQIDFNEVLAKTNYKDLLEWIPSLSLMKDLEVDQIKDLFLKGNFNGTLYDFVTKAQIQSPLGNAKTAIRIQIPEKAEPKYEGQLETYHFNIGKLLHIDSLSWVNFNGKIAGSSFSLEKAKMNIEGRVDSIAYNQYVYSNIVTDGIIQKGAFNGSFRIKDPNIHFISNVILDFKKSKPSFNVVGDLLNANFTALHLSKKPIQLTGVLDLNFEGINIDQFIGSAKFYNGKLKGQYSTIQFDSLTIQSNFVAGKKRLQIASDDLLATIEGNFDISHLPASVQYFTQAYLPAYIPAPKNTPANQQFNFQIKTNYFEPYIRLFNSSFSGFNNIDINGSFNTINKSFITKGNIPFIQWKNYSIKNGTINSKGNNEQLFADFKSENFSISDSIHFLNPTIHLNSSNDISKITIDATSHAALELVHLEGKINTYTDGIIIHWSPSYFILNQKQWNIDNGGILSFRKNNSFAKDFKLSQGIQEIKVGTAKQSNGFQVSLKNIILGDLTKLFFTYPQLEGVTNGTIQMNALFDNFNLNTNLSIDQFSFNNEPIGPTTLMAGYTASTGLIPFKFESPNNDYHLRAEGSYNIKDSTNPLDANLYLNQSNFGLVEQFIGGVLHELKGKAEGKIHFGGRIENPYLLGEASIKNASFIVDYTKVKYFIDSTTILFTKEGIDFGTLAIKDRWNRPAIVKGKIRNQGFSHLEYDMEMNSPKIELLNMEPIDNNYFYGHAVGKASLSIKGPEENIKMIINADVNDSSHIILPNTTSKETGKSEFIVFKKYGRSAIKSAELPSYNLVVDLDIIANNKTQIDVIFDELTGDVIKAVGNGRIKMRAGNLEPLTIRGKYNIESGNYDFNFQSFIKKPFELIPEAGNYIEWTGDPFNADIHVDARYTAERVSLNELVGAANFSNAVKSYRGNVFVIAALRNKLSRPDIKFSLAFPQGNPISSDNEFSQFISRLERDDNEILKQVSFLIVFNSFAPVSFNNNATTNAYNATSIGINTISQLLTKEINKSITNLLTKVTGDKSLRFDVGSSVYNSGNLLDPTGTGIAINANKIDRQRVNLKLGRTFLNDKIIVNFGGDLDFNIRSSTAIQNGNFQWLPDLNIEFILTRNRKLRAIIFNRNSLDITGSSFGRRNRQGISISYRQDFDNFIF